MGMSTAAMRYLLTIYELSQEGGAVRSVDISRELGVSPASVVHMLGVLGEEGLVSKRHYGRVQFTDRGIRAANQLYTKCMLLETFLSEELCVEQETARRIAEIQEKMEADMNGLLAKQKAESEALLKELEDNYNRRHEEYAEALFQKMIKG